MILRERRGKKEIDNPVRRDGRQCNVPGGGRDIKTASRLSRWELMNRASDEMRGENFMGCAGQRVKPLIARKNV